MTTDSEGETLTRMDDAAKLQKSTIQLADEFDDERNYPEYYDDCEEPDS